MEQRRNPIVRSSVTRAVAAFIGVGALAVCGVLAGTADAGDNSGPGGGGDSTTSTDNSTSSSDASTSSSDASTSSSDASTSSTDDSTSSTDPSSSSSSEPGSSSSTPGTGSGAAPGTGSTFPAESWEALALEACAGQTGDPEVAAALLDALDSTGATEQERGSRRLPLLVERCAMTFVGEIDPELGRPVTSFEQIANDEVIVLPADTTNDVTPNDAQLALLDTAADEAFPLCTPQPAPLETPGSSSPASSEPGATTASSDLSPTTTGASSDSTTSIVTPTTAAAGATTSLATPTTAPNRCVVPPPEPTPTASSEPATGTTVLESSTSAPGSTVPGTTDDSSSTSDVSTSAP